MEYFKAEQAVSYRDVFSTYFIWNSEKLYGLDVHFDLYYNEVSIDALECIKSSNPKSKASEIAKKINFDILSKDDEFNLSHIIGHLNDIVFNNMEVAKIDINFDIWKKKDILFELINCDEFNYSN